MNKVGRPHKSDPFEFNSIINIKSLFANSKYNTQQNISRWKKEHRTEVLEYHKAYNEENDIYQKLGKFCACCDKYVSNFSKHQKTKKHILKFNKCI